VARIGRAFDGGVVMIANSLLLTVAIFLALGFWLMGELKFLIPYKLVLFRAYGTVILGFLGILFLNVFAAIYALNRRFFLKDTGRKLTHLDKQLHTGQVELPPPSVDEELN
jgi:hypothetical protein